LPNLCSYEEATTICKEICKSKYTENQLSCGHSVPKSRNRRIINGNISKPNQWPWHASLRLYNEHYCGASILSQHYAITAAHCVDKTFTRTENPDDFKVIVGLHDRNEIENEKQILNVSRIFLHAGYELSQHDRGDFYFFVVSNDLAILELAQPIDFGMAEVQNICLPDNENRIPDNYNCKLIGWGQTIYDDNTSLSNQLRYAEIKTMPVKICNEKRAFNNKVSSVNSVCAKGGNFTISPCNKDSGGGMACFKSGRWFLNGIVSSGYKCGGQDAYSLFTNVVNFKPWIVRTLLSKNGSSQLEPTKNYVLFIIFLLTFINIYWLT